MSPYDGAVDSKPEEFSLRLFARREDDPLVATLHPAWQVHFPTPMDIVHLQFDDGTGWRMVAGRFDEEEIRPHLRDAKDVAIQAQAHAHQCGVPAIGAWNFHAA